MSKLVILDVDGTLVDTNYQHALAWWRALRQNDIIVPIWRIHRTVGMGGDKMIAALCGDDVEKEKGDDIRAAEKALYLALIDEVQPLEGARELIVDLKDRGHSVVLASSAKSNELDHYIDLLDCRELVDAWTDSSDVESTKPDPDLVHAAIDKVEADEVVMLGDSPWDCKAAA
ncbi:MAG TPA: HAD family hydrolase, partial [Actinomycetota bacterium]|nr:HAD family hydrolase [Actinomycetota bacterium]